MPDRRRFTVSLSADEADVLDAVAHLNGYTGRPGAWIGDQVRQLVLERKGDDDVKRLSQAREQYPADSWPADEARPRRHRRRRSMNPPVFPSPDLEQERTFRCESCGTRWPEDDLQQVQPDGRYACPFEKCGIDTVVAMSTDGEGHQ